jgi:hypothetical protein
MKQCNQLEEGKREETRSYKSLEQKIRKEEGET